MKQLSKSAVITISAVTALSLGIVTLLLHKVLQQKEDLVRRKRKKIFVITREKDWDDVYENEIIPELAVTKVLGLDCEWLSQGHSKVALLQLSTQSGVCVLVRLCKMDTIPKTLKDLLQNKKILKVGVAVSGDAKRLLNDYGMPVMGCVDLRHLVVRSRKFHVKVREHGLGLSNQSAVILGRTLDKSYHLRCGDWEAETLSDEQIEYAAMDAITAVDIFTELVLHNNRPFTRINDLFSFMKRSESLCQGIVDISFHDNGVGHRAQNNTRSSSSPRNTPKSKTVRAYSQRQKPLYHNCQLRAPDGQLLCTCDLKKAEWYIMKGLGDKISDDPLTVQLKFEPSGRPESDENYYIKEKQNICVVCGGDDSFIRKNVVPHEYRKYFPPLMKSHKSHDVLLLCIPCHQLSGQYDIVLRQHYVELCDAPLGSEETTKYKQDPQITAIRSAAKALLNGGSKIPPERLRELETRVMDYYGTDVIDNETLQRAISMETRVKNVSFMPHGQKVVDYVMEHEGLIQFEKNWRQQFLDNMKPKYLPEMWSVDHCHDQLSEYESSLRQKLGLDQ